MLSRLRRLFGRAERGEARGSQKEAGLRSWYRRTRSSTGKTSSQCSEINEQEQQMTKMREMIIQIQRMTCEKDELRGILAQYTDKDLDNRLDFELALLKIEHEKVMSELKYLPQEISEALDKHKLLNEKVESCRISYCELIVEWTELKLGVTMLRKENRKLLQEQFALQKSCEETKRFCDELTKKICRLYVKKQQEKEVLEKKLQDLQNQIKLVTQQRDLAENMQHHTDVIETRSEILQCDLEGATAQEESSLQTELLSRTTE